MKNVIEAIYKFLFVAGVLFIGVGIMSIFIDTGYAEKYNQLEQSGKKVQVEIIDKGVYFSGGGSRTRNRHEFFDIEYLGKSEERENSRIDPMLKEFDTYEKGDMVSVLFDPDDPYEAFIIKTPEQLKKIEQKKFFVMLYGIIMILLSLGLGRLHKKL